MANPNCKADRGVDWPIANLKQHPKQSEMFIDPTEHEVKKLAETMKAGLDHPIEILPDGTIICGHRRTAAARLLGWTTIPAIVRNDLANNPVAAEMRLIEENLNRRQMTPMQIARCYWRLKRIEGWSASGLRGNRDLRDLIAKKFSLSGRQLDRYLRVIEHCPLEVQQAVDRGELGIMPANAVAGMSAKDKERVAAAIRKGLKATDAVKSVEAPKKFRDLGVHDALRRLAAQLERATTLLEPQFDRIDKIHPGVRDALVTGIGLIKRLLNIANAKGK